MLKINYKPKNEVVQINQFWLRDHCRCNKCYNEATKQRRFNLLDIPKDITAEEIVYLNDGKLLKITCMYIQYMSDDSIIIAFHRDTSGITYTNILF